MMIDSSGALWAWSVGKKQREETRWITGVKADRWCPFREGTVHRYCWYAGWRGKNLPVWPERVYE